MRQGEPSFADRYWVQPGSRRRRAGRAAPNIVTQVTGENLVFWTKSGSVFHLCEDVPDVNRESEDNTIYSGTVAEAHEDGKDRLTKKWRSEAEVCGFDVPADLEDKSTRNRPTDHREPLPHPTATTVPRGHFSTTSAARDPSGCDGWETTP